jgi:hypothetical protein
MLLNCFVVAVIFLSNIFMTRLERVVLPLDTIGRQQ